MKYWFLVVPLTAYAMSMFKSKDVKPAPSKPPVVVVTPTSPSSLPVKIDAKITGTPAQVARLSKVISGVERMINSPEFDARILGATYKNYAADPKEVLRRIKDGEERLYTGKKWNIRPKDHTIQMDWKFAYHKTYKVTGWTYPDTMTIWIHNRRWDERSDRAIAGTVCHEALGHKLGYDHVSASSTQSVPYSLSNICYDLYPKFALSTIATK